jgi:hypothetical protein
MPDDKPSWYNFLFGQGALKKAAGQPPDDKKVSVDYKTKTLDIAGMAQAEADKQATLKKKKSKPINVGDMMQSVTK